MTRVSSLPFKINQCTWLINITLQKVVIIYNFVIRMPHISGTVLCEILWCNECSTGLLLATVCGFIPLAWRRGHISYKRLYLFNDNYNILKNTGFLFLLIGCYQGWLPAYFPSSEITLCACPTPSEPVNHQEEFVQFVTCWRGSDNDFKQVSAVKGGFVAWLCYYKFCISG